MLSQTKRSTYIRRTIVGLVIVLPEALLFYAAHNEWWNIWGLIVAVPLWVVTALSLRYVTVRFFFQEVEVIRSQVLTTLLSVNYFLFGFGVWIFTNSFEALYIWLPVLMLTGYYVAWVVQNRYLWELVTFASLFLGILLGWHFVIDLAFPGGVLAIIALYASFIAAVEWAKIHRFSSQKKWLFAFLLALIMSEFSWVMVFWPISFLSLALVMLGTFYVVGLVAVESEKKQLGAKHAINYSVTALAFFLAIIFSSSWKPPFL